MQKHSFPSSTCGVVITYVLDLDQEKAPFKFRDPENGKCADDEDSAVKTLTFSDEIVMPASMPDFISPHIARWGRYDWEKCREEERAPTIRAQDIPVRRNAVGFISSAATGIC